LDGADGDLKTGEYLASNDRSCWAIDGNRIVNVHNQNEVLDLKGGSRGNGTAICVWQRHGKENQQWHFDYV